MCADIHAHVDDCVIRYPAVLLLLAAAAQKENKRRDAKKVVAAAAATTLVFSLFGLCYSDGRALFIFPSDIPTGQHLFTFSFFFLSFAQVKKKLRRSRFKFEITRVVRNFNQRHRELCNSTNWNSCCCCCCCVIKRRFWHHFSQFVRILFALGCNSSANKSTRQRRPLWKNSNWFFFSFF